MTEANGGMRNEIVKQIAEARRGAGVRVFLAAPMSGFDSDTEYKEHRLIVNETCERLEQGIVESVYFAGRDISSKSDFTKESDAFRSDFNALLNCDLFVLYYPKPVRSSVLVEAGMAIGSRKPCLFVAPHADDLVYLLRNAEEASGTSGIPPIAIRKFGAEAPSAKRLTDFIVETLQLFEIQHREYSCA